MAKEYIPREDVINDIGELFTICRETLPNECGHHFIVENELQSHLDYVRNLPAADVVQCPRWTPVTERCPEKSGDYLVFDDCRNLYVNEWHCLLKKWQYDDSRITHWMPLPEPPKEDKS